MGANVIIVTVDGSKYKIEKNGISDFALIGVLECIVADLKSINRKTNATQIAKEILTAEKVKETPGETPVSSSTVISGDSLTHINEKSADSPIIERRAEATTEAAAPDLKSRIIKAREAIRGLKGRVEESDLQVMTDDELQEEFEALTAQYKRLKNSQTPKEK